MSVTEPVGIGFIGCGKIAGPYAQSARQHPERLRIAAAYDLAPERAQAFAAEHGGAACRTLEELLASPDMDVVANLSIHPVRRVRGASADVLIPERTIATGPQQGETFRVGTLDHVTGLLEFGGGLPARLTASFTIGASTLPGIEVYGTEGTLTMANSFLFNSEVRFRAADSQEWKPVPFVSPPFPGLEWSRGLLDMADALRDGRDVHCTGRQAYHILDVSLAILESAAEGRSVEVTSTF